jgi:hypothetical protein
MKLVIDLSSNTVVGGTTDDGFKAASNQLLIEAPEEFEMASAAEWSFDGVSVDRDPVAALDRAKAARKARIKAEAARLIEALDWKLVRAREREAAGWTTLAGVDAVLAEREAIRRSSGAAESAVDAMTDVGSVQAFVWSVDVLVPAPRRLTQTQFAGRFTDAELQGILSAAQANPAMGAWWEKFKLAKDINLDDPATQAGVQALEFAGLIAAGRGAEILA